MENLESEGNRLQTMASNDTNLAVPVTENTTIVVSDTGTVTTSISPSSVGHPETVTHVSSTSNLNKETENEHKAPSESTSTRGRKRKPRMSSDYLYTPVVTRTNTKTHEKKEKKIIQRNPFKDVNPESESGFIWLIESKSALPAELCADRDCNKVFRRKRHYHCRLCDNSKLGPIETVKKYWNHLDRHLKNFIPVNGKMLCECRMHCTDNGGVLVIMPHFHCPSCPHIGVGTLYTDMLLHIESHPELSTEPVVRQDEEFFGYPTKARQPKVKPPEELNLRQIGLLTLPKKARPHKEHAYYIKRGNKKKNLLPPSEIFDYQSVSLNPNLFEVLLDEPETVLAYIANHANIKFERDGDSKYNISGSVDDVQEAYTLLSDMLQKASQGNLKSIYNFQNDENVKGVPGAPILPTPNQYQGPEGRAKVPCVCLACKKEYISRNSLSRHMLQAHNYTVCECGVSIDGAEGGEDHQCDLSTRSQYKEVEFGIGSKQYVFLPSMNGKKRGRCLHCGEVFTGKYKDHHRNCKQIYMTQCDFVWRCPRCSTVFPSKQQLRTHIGKCDTPLDSPKRQKLMYYSKEKDASEDVNGYVTEEGVSPNNNTGAIDTPNMESRTHITTDSASPNPDVTNCPNDEIMKHDDVGELPPDQDAINNPNTETMPQVTGEQLHESNRTQSSQSEAADTMDREVSSRSGVSNKEKPKVIMKPKTGECCCQVCGETMELKANVIAKHSCFQKKINANPKPCEKELAQQNAGSTENDQFIVNMSTDNNTIDVDDNNVDVDDVTNHSDLVEAGDQAMEESLSSSGVLNNRGNIGEMNTKNPERILIDDSELLYRCRYFLCKCGQMSKTRRLMKDHIRRVHMPKSLLCAHCGKVFSSNYKYRQHLTAEHTLELKAPCKICNRMMLKSSMEKHLQRHEGKGNQSGDKGPKLLKCTQCDYQANFPSDIRYHHMKIHSGRYTCPHCSTRFGTQFRLEAHIRDLHTNPGRFECHICKKKFNRQSYLNVHIQRHNNVKRYHCEVCNKGFLEHYRMLEHLEVHKSRSERQFPFSCDVCEKGFSQKRVLVAHKNTHTGERPYICKYCEVAFSSQSGRAQHIRLKHNINLFPCPTCGMSFKLQWKLKAHMKKHTGDSQHQCQQCGKRFTLKSSLNRHIVSCVIDKASALAEATARNSAMTALLTSAAGANATLTAEPQGQLSVELYMCCGCNLTFTSLEHINQHSCTNSAAIESTNSAAIGSTNSAAIESTNSAAIERADSAVSGADTARVELPHMSTSADEIAKEHDSSVNIDHTDSNEALNIANTETANDQNLQHGEKLQGLISVGSDGQNNFNLQNINVNLNAGAQLMRLSSTPMEGYVVPTVVPGDINANVNELMQRPGIVADVASSGEQPGTEVSQMSGIANQQFVLQHDQSDGSKTAMIPYSLTLGNNQVAVNTGLSIVEAEGERYVVGHQGQIVVGTDGQQYIQIHSGGQQFQLGQIQSGNYQEQQNIVDNDQQEHNVDSYQQQRNIDSDLQEDNIDNDHQQDNVDIFQQQSNIDIDQQEGSVDNDQPQNNVDCAQ